MLWLVILVILLEGYIFTFLIQNPTPKNVRKHRSHQSGWLSRWCFARQTFGIMSLSFQLEWIWPPRNFNTPNPAVDYLGVFFLPPLLKKKNTPHSFATAFSFYRKTTRTEICQEAGDALKPFFWTSTMKVFGRIQRPNECSKSTLVTFHYIGWLIRIVFFS